MNSFTTPTIADLIRDLIEGRGVTDFSTALVNSLELPAATKASGHAARRRACVYLDRSDIGSTLVAGAKPGKEGLTRTFSMQVAGVDEAYFEGTLRVIVIGEVGDAEAILESMKSECDGQLGTMKAEAAGAFASSSLQKNSQKRAPQTTPDGLCWGMVASSLASKLLFTQISQYGPADSTVLITGETGVGKEMVARALHVASGRKGEFVAINCGAITPTLLESTLFGHARGAFTGANTERKGLFEVAEGGTIFLDEIGEMPVEQQTTLLRVLQERAIRRIGASTEKSINVRVVAATNQDLRARVSQGLFREDLYYRLSVLPLHIAPLRERREDIPALVNYQLSKISAERKLSLRITGDAMEFLKAHNWPGNVRELVNCLERAAVSHDGGTIDVDNIALEPRMHGLPRIGVETGEVTDIEAVSEIAFQPGKHTYDEAMFNYERLILQTAVEYCNGNVTEAADLINMPRTTLRRRIRILDIKCNSATMIRPLAADEANHARIA